MPFSDEFIKVKRHFQNLYNDKAKADLFAFEKAFKTNIPILRSRKKKFKVQKTDELFDF